jgi:glutaryl-CoA dehydrogenase
VGAAGACYEAALAYAKEQIAFGKPIAAYQLTQQKLAEMPLGVSRGTLVALHPGRMKDRRALRPEHVSMGKMGNVRGAIEVARPPHPRRQRDHARVPGDPPRQQPRGSAHVRGHA